MKFEKSLELLKNESHLIDGWSGTLFGGGASVRNFAMPTYFKNLAAWLPSRLAAKKAAFTLAEVLITLSIIGVVAAITLPTLIQNYQKTVWVNQLKKTYSSLNEGFKQIVASEGCTTLECADISRDSHGFIDFAKVKTKEKFVKTFKLENVYVDGVPDNSIYNYKIKTLDGGDKDSISLSGPVDGLVGTTPNGEIIYFGGILFSDEILVDINGLKSPNTLGRDVFAFSYFDFNDTVMVTPIFSKKWQEHFEPLGMGFSSEEERIQKINYSCSVTNNSGYLAESMPCAEKIIMDGWKMNY